MKTIKFNPKDAESILAAAGLRIIFPKAELKEAGRTSSVDKAAFDKAVKALKKEHAMALSAYHTTKKMAHRPTELIGKLRDLKTFAPALTVLPNKGFSNAIIQLAEEDGIEAVSGEVSYKPTFRILLRQKSQEEVAQEEE